MRRAGRVTSRAAERRGIVGLPFPADVALSTVDTRLVAALRASMATTSGLTDPAAKVAVMPASTWARGTRRCSSSTSIRARVPAVSPCLARAAAQNASCAAVNDPSLRACASGVEPGSAPGLPARISR